MAYYLKKDHVKNWDLQQLDEKPMFNIDNDDDQDIYISERSSVASSNDMNQTPRTTIKRLPTPTPTPSPPLILPQKQPHTLRYHYNELPENGIPIATQIHLQRKEDKKKEKSLRKAPPGQGNLVSFPETKPSELSDNYYPYWYYYKVKNPDWIMRHRQTIDGQVIPYESLDPSQYAQQSALTTSPIKPRQQPRKSRYNGVSTNQSNQDKQRHEQIEKNSSTSSSNLTSHENHDNNYQQQRPSPKPPIPLKDADNDEYRSQPTRRIISQQRRKFKTENDWTDHYMQSLSSSKIPQDANSLIITSNSLTNRPRNGSKIPDKNSLTSDVDENGKHRHHQPHHYHYQQNQTQSYNPPSIPSQQNHHLHVRRRPPSGAYIGTEFQVVDVSFKKSERSPYFQQTRDPFQTPIPPIYSQSPYLPPIVRDYQHKTNTTRFPTEYYGTLARQTHVQDWEETIEMPKIYKYDPQTRFYDHYLTNVVDKRLAA